MLLIAPAHANRRSFARWATRHGVRTRSSTTFAVPDRLFVDIPEDVLVGATVDGQPYTTNGTSSADADGPTAPQPLAPETAPEPVSVPASSEAATVPTATPTIVPF